MPEHFDAVHRAAWAEFSASLLSMRVLTPADGPALEQLCDALIRYRAAVVAHSLVGGTEETKTGTRRTGAATELDAARDGLRVLRGEFGLSPSARARVEAAPPGAGETERDRRRRDYFGT